MFKYLIMLLLCCSIVFGDGNQTNTTLNETVVIIKQNLINDINNGDYYTFITYSLLAIAATTLYYRWYDG